MKPVSCLTAEEAKGVRYILMDIDDTLTREGKLLSSSYSALWQLKEAGLAVIPVTGRPAGWCDLIAREWPVDGVIGENGALVFWEERDKGEITDRDKISQRLPVLKTEFHPNAVRNDHPVLKRIKERTLDEFPELRLAKDQFARLFDLALDFAEEEPVLPLSVAERVKAIAEEEGATAKISSIHVNVWMGNYNKLSMAEYFLAKRFRWEAGRDDRDVVFVGDSPNDEPMFARFPLACAVANVRRYEPFLKKLPAYVAEKECGDGFAEIAAIILEKRKSPDHF
jgi:HAD superfamily hydrolase (TIGR01484 family)